VESLQSQVNYEKSVGDELRRELDATKEQVVTVTRERDDLSGQIHILKELQVCLAWVRGKALPTAPSPSHPTPTHHSSLTKPRNDGLNIACMRSLEGHCSEWVCILPACLVLQASGPVGTLRLPCLAAVFVLLPLCRHRTRWCRPLSLRRACAPYSGSLAMPKSSCRLPWASWSDGMRLVAPHAMRPTPVSHTHTLRRCCYPTKPLGAVQLPEAAKCIPTHTHT
jgi:hypothetical protein